MPSAGTVDASAGTEDREGSRGYLLIDLFGALTLGLLALVLGLHEIDRWAFWHDEIFTMGAVAGTWDDLVRFAQYHEINMFTYYATLKAWMSFATSEAWIRSLSAIYGALAVVALFGLVRSLLGRRVAWLATAIFALNAFLLQYAQEARVYTLGLLLAILSTWALVRALQAPSRTRWVLYIALAALLPYTHLVLIAMLPVQAIAALAARPRPRCVSLSRSASRSGP